MDFFLRVFTLLLFAGWQIYWKITELEADKEKPKTQERPGFLTWKRISHQLVWLVGGLVILQLLGLQVWPMQANIFLQVVGLIMVVIGLGCAIVARYQLGTNWANGYEYQIKKKQTLVTKGIYAYIRNPIYTGIVTGVIGAELVAQSYLFFVFLLLFWGAYQQSKREEKILEAHFGKEYRDYKKRSKMLIPFLF